jgi:hypothetical protein
MKKIKQSDEGSHRAVHVVKHEHVFSLH